MKLPIFLFCLFSLLDINCSNANIASTNEDSVSSTTNAQNDTTIKTHFGVMVAKTQGTLVPPSQQAKIARALGVNYVRARIDLDSWSGSNDAYDIYKDAGLKVLLNINSGIPRSAVGEASPIPFPTDMDAYSKKLHSIFSCAI